MNMKSLLRPTLSLLLAFTFLTGVAYPALITGVAGLAFPSQAHGSVLGGGGGSELIGQAFTGRAHFWGRPSATSPQPYDGRASGGSNLGPQNPALLDAVRARIEALRAADPGNGAPIPVDLVTSSGSGLDPHISPAAALYQVPRVARESGLSEETVRGLVHSHVEGRTFGLLGEPRVNVLQLNLALDRARSRG
jgi:K+-transporting ATPase ATPase C chain